MNVVERVGRAIVASIAEQLGAVRDQDGDFMAVSLESPADWGSGGSSFNTTMLARAAIEAMREPSEAMIRALDVALHEHWPNARKMAIAAQEAMIDSALKEGDERD